MHALHDWNDPLVISSVFKNLAKKRKGKSSLSIRIFQLYAWTFMKDMLLEVLTTVKDGMKVEFVYFVLYIAFSMQLMS